jgi:prefoldin subunit 5
MADVEPDELVVESDAGVTVEKSYEPEDFPVPAIAFVIRSERDEPASIRLVDTVPQEVPSEDIGFHPEYGAEFWEQDGNTITFTRTFEPDEEFVTVYGLRGQAADDIGRFLTEPRLDGVEPSGGADDSEAAVRDVIDEEETGEDLEGGTTDVEPDVDADAEASDDSEEANSSDPVDLESDEVDFDIELEDPDGGTRTTGEPDQQDDVDVPDVGFEPDVEPEPESESEMDTDIEPEPETEPETDAEPDSETDIDIEPERETEPDPDADSGAGFAAGSVEAASEGTAGVEGSVIAALAEELRAVDPDDEDVAAVRETLLAEEAGSDSDLRETVETTADRLDDIESDLESTEAAVADVESELREFESAVEGATAEAADAAERAESVREDVADLEALDPATEGQVEELSADIERMEDRLAEVVELRDRLTDALGGLGAEDDE